MGQQRLGINLEGLVATLRERVRLSMETIRWHPPTVHGLLLSAGAIVGVIRRTAETACGAVAEVVDRIRGSPEVFADETGGRQDGEKAFMWRFSTTNERYFVRRNRRKQVLVINSEQ